MPQFTVLLPTNQEIYQEHELVTGRTDKICTGWGRGNDFRRRFNPPNFRYSSLTRKRFLEPITARQKGDSLNTMT